MTSPKPITIFHTHISERAIERVSAVLRSTWVNEGAEVKQFESELARVLGVSHPVTVNCATSGLHLALAQSGVGEGDEVALPAQTFVATGLVILMQRATPVFVDIDPHTGNMSPSDLARKITPRTKAVMPVHWGGYPCDLDEINRIAGEHSLTVIEDAAHALGATYKGKPIGSVSRYAAFSFQAIKHLTTGDGGMLCCLNEADAHEAKVRRLYGIDRDDKHRTRHGDLRSDISVLGYKYHMNNIAAAIGLGNIEDFPQRLARRREIARHYRERFARVPGLELLESQPDREHAYWLFTVLVERREQFTARLAEAGIQTSVVDLSIDRNTIFGGHRVELPGQELFNSRQISIPVHEGLDDDDVERIITCVARGW